MMPVMTAPHDPHHPDSHYIGNIDLGTEKLQLYRRHEGQDYPHQNADQRNYGEGLCPGFLDGRDQVRPAEPGIAPQHPEEGHGRFAKEGEHLPGPLDHIQGRVSNPLQERWTRFLTRHPLALVLRRGQIQKFADSLRQSGLVDTAPSPAAGVDDLRQKYQKSAVPLTELGNIERDPGDSRLRGDELLSLLNGWEDTVRPPVSREPKKQRCQPSDNWNSGLLAYKPFCWILSLSLSNTLVTST